jgi:hypothetical protein
VGDPFDPADAPPVSAGARPAAAAGFTVLSPSGRPLEPVGGAGPRTVVLSETGFYEIRPAAASGGDPIVVAVNGAVGESDLSPVDPAELAASVSSANASPGTGAGQEITVEERERRQSLWWYLLAIGLLLLGIEAAVASRLPRIA